MCPVGNSIVVSTCIPIEGCRCRITLIEIEVLILVPAPNEEDLIDMNRIRCKSEQNIMTSREHVLAAASCKLPDRLPLFKPNIMNTNAPYEKGLLDFLDSFGFDDFAGPGRVTNAPSNQEKAGNDEFIDGYGCIFRYRGVGLPYCTFSPLAEAETVRDVETFSWPEIDEFVIETFDTDSDYATMVHVPHLFHQYHYLRGFERWMLDIRENPVILQAIAERIFHNNVTLIMQLLDRVGSRTDMVAAGDDFGWSQAPYMSPLDFRTFIKPYYRKMIARIKERYPHIKFYLHSHGQIMDLVPDLIECGVDILNPVLPLDNMDPVKLKREYGNRLCFHGGIDIENIVPFGTLEQVKEHVKSIIDTLGEGGGYWFKLQVISPIVPPENIITAYELAREYTS